MIAVELENQTVSPTTLHCPDCHSFETEAYLSVGHSRAPQARYRCRNCGCNELAIDDMLIALYDLDIEVKYR